MKIKGLSKLSVVSSAWILGLAAYNALALSPAVEQLVKWETEANGVSFRSSAPIEIKNYEIPLSALSHDFAENLDPRIKDALVFKKNGRDYVRWIINPEDTKWHVKLEEWLTSKGLSTTKHTHFRGYLTASRSLILEDPSNGAQFSTKVSTNHTGGNWTDKQQHFDDSNHVRMTSDYIRDAKDKVKMNTITFLDEPAMFGIEDIDQGMLIRSLGELPDNGKYYLPGFSAVHEEVGREIAARNGSTNPAQFWNEHYNKKAAAAIAEMAAHTGLTYDSPHSQNFLIELDHDMRPTGKIVLRDPGDVYVWRKFFRASGNMEFVNKFEAGNVINNLSVAFGPLHGNTPPDWMSEADYKQWSRDFFDAYRAKFSEISGVPVRNLKAQGAHSTSMYSYYSKDYDVDASWEDYMRWAKCFQGSPVNAAGLPCPEWTKRFLRPGVAAARAPVVCDPLLRGAFGP